MKCILPIAGALFSAQILVSCAHHHEHHGPGAEGHAIHHDFKDAKEWSRRFDSVDRAKWQKPQEIVDLMAIPKGALVADIGAGTGYMLPFLSRAVGDKGQVFALDVEINLVNHMKKRVRDEGLQNVDVELIAIDSPEIAGKGVSRLLMLNAWHHISSRENYSKELFRQVSGGAKVFVVEPEPGAGGPGPGDKYRLSADGTIAELSAAGFKCRSVAESLAYQYVVECTK